MLKLIIIIGLIVAFGFLIKAQLERTSSMNELLESKCEQAYYGELDIIEKEKQLGLDYDEDMTALRKICGNKLIDRLTRN